MYVVWSGWDEVVVVVLEGCVFLEVVVGEFIWWYEFFWLVVVEKGVFVFVCVFGSVEDGEVVGFVFGYGEGGVFYVEWGEDVFVEEFFEVFVWDDFDKVIEDVGGDVVVLMSVGVVL